MASSTDNDEEEGNASPQRTPQQHGSAAFRFGSVDVYDAPPSRGVSVDHEDDEDDGGGEDDDDGPAPARGDGPCATWTTLLLRFLLSVVSAAVSAALVVLYPVYLIVPRFITDGLFRGVFRIGYLVYLTPVGAWLHSRGLKSNTQAHSVPPPPLQLSTCTVTVVPIMDNNYSFLIIDRATGRAALVDPADPHAAVRAVEAARCELTHILTTHHHHDHAGGNHALVAAALQSQGRALTVVGGARDRVPACTQRVKDGDVVRLGSTAIRVIETPCHTRGHVVYSILRAGASPSAVSPAAAHGPVVVGSPGGVMAQQPQQQFGTVEALFSGDTVFVGGVGAFFHGDARDMERNLMTALAPCPDDALLLCGHEYTVDNLRFAAWLEPDNAEVVGTYLAATARRNLGESTIPSTLGQERRTNPYFRTTDWRLHAAVAQRRATMKARQGRTPLQRIGDSVFGGGPATPSRGVGNNRPHSNGTDNAGGGGGNPLVEVMPPHKLYGQLQELLATGAWQQFRLKGRTPASQRRRAAAVAAAVEIGRQNRMRTAALSGGSPTSSEV